MIRQLLSLRGRAAAGEAGVALVSFFAAILARIDHLSSFNNERSEEEQTLFFFLFYFFYFLAFLLSLLITI